MTVSNSLPKRRGIRRLSRVLAVVTAAAIGMITLATAPASATQTCTAQVGSNVCLSNFRLSNGNYAVHIGIDDHISQADAQAIIDQPGDPFFTVVTDSDGNALFFVPETDIGASQQDGLSADFDVTVLPSQLHNARVLGRIRLTDNRNGTRVFLTPPLSPPY